MTPPDLRRVIDPKTLFSSVLAAGIVAGFSMYTVVKVLESEMATLRQTIAEADLRREREFQAHIVAQDARLMHDEDVILLHLQSDREIHTRREASP